MAFDMDSVSGSFYSNIMPAEMETLKNRKSNMTLDFASQGGAGRRQKLTKEALLTSPDLRMWSMTSPEVEKMLIQNNGNVTTTPTPTQFLFPRSVTEEQEAYARGFVDALENLKKQQHDDKDDCSDSVMTTMQPVEISSETSQVSAISIAQMSIPNSSMYTFTTTTELPGNTPAIPTTVHTLASQGERTSSPLVNMNLPRVAELKEEPQTVPCLSADSPLSNSSAMSPIDMDTQEMIKTERKRARNRIAARKCRFRKIERITKLEEKVSELKGNNGDLTQTVVELRAQVARLKESIMQHSRNGCNVMLPQNIS